MKVLHEKCEKSKAEDKKLPRDSYLVTYKVKDEVLYDIVRGGSLVEIFDCYFDTHGKEAVVGITWSGGIVSPKTFDSTNADPERPKKKRRKKE